jgi:hypothetical protein
MKRRLLLSDISCLVCASLSQESICLLGASHPPSNLNFDVNFYILGLILILHYGQPAWQSLPLSIPRAKPILQIRVSPPRCICTPYVFIFPNQPHHRLRPRKE